MDVSVIIPVYKPDKQILDKSLRELKKQKFHGKIQVVKVEKNLGLSESLNDGIKTAKHDVIVSLHQDCVPENENWLQNLTNPLKEKDVIASVSKVELPEQLWKKFDVFARAMTLKELGVIQPLLDEKGCAYKKSALLKCGLFNSKEFRTAGEDFDMYLKIQKLGKIAYPGCKIIHYHETNFKNRLKKQLQNANGYGALVKIHGMEMTNWWLGVLKAIPILGLIINVISYPFNQSLKYFIPYLIISPISHALYVYGFWKGFLMGKQTV